MLKLFTFSARTLLCGLFLLLPLISANAQFKAAIQGTVADATGALVPDASVTLTNKETGAKQTTTTSGDGFYSISGLSPGTYSLVVEKSGFKRQSFENVVVSAEATQGLDDQVQQMKSDVLSITEELSRLEEKLLYPSGTQVAVFIALAKGDQMRLDAVRLQIDGRLVAHHIYSAKELEALRKGGVQRIYIGNVATGDHKLDVLMDGKSIAGADFSQTEHFNVRKEVKPKMVGLTLAGPGSTVAPIALGEW